MLEQSEDTSSAEEFLVMQLDTDGIIDKISQLRILELRKKQKESIDRLSQNIERETTASARASKTTIKHKA